MIGIMEITFIRLRESEYQDFCNDVKEILSIAVVETFGRPEDGSEIIPNDEILGIVSDPEYDTYAVFADGVDVFLGGDLLNQIMSASLAAWQIMSAACSQARLNSWSSRWRMNRSGCAT